MASSHLGSKSWEAEVTVGTALTNRRMRRKEILALAGGDVIPTRRERRDIIGVLAVFVIVSSLFLIDAPLLILRLSSFFTRILI